MLHGSSRLSNALSAGLFALTLLLGGASRATEPVDLALVLAADVSRSINEEEFRLQRQGYAAALTNPKVLAAIRSGPLRKVAVTFVEWSNDVEQAVVADWTVLRDDASAAALAARILDAPRSFAGRTSISAAIDFSMRQLARGGFEASRRIIDVSGDGTNNAGRPVPEARDAAIEEGVTINALVILNARPEGGYLRSHVDPPGGLPEYFRQNVIGGPGAFLLQVDGFASFAEAIVQKLVNEIAGLPPSTRFAAAEPAQPRPYSSWKRTMSSSPR